MARPLSCGTLIVNERGELLLAHVTGARQWDIPKGGTDPDEEPRTAAVRETLEETGIALDPGQLVDLGRHAYLPRKDLHLFLASVDGAQVDISACRCTSVFPDRRTGQPRPEVDAFRWVPLDEVPARVTANLWRVLAPLLAG